MEKLSVDLGMNDFEFKNSLIDFIIKNFKVKSIKYDTIDFEMSVILKNGENIKEKNFLNVDFCLANNEIVAIQNHNNSLPRIYGYDLTTQTSTKLVDFIFFNYPQNITYGNVYTITDSKFQNFDEVNRWIRRKLNIPTYVEIFPNPLYKTGAPGMDMIAKEFISIESLPGHSHQMNYDERLWFGSCWQMYFSPIYYKYIPKFLFDEFTDCFENKVFNNGLRRITLFENIEDFDMTESRAKQWAFRRALGIDSIAHELTTANNRIEPENLPVLITKKDCQHGQTKVIRFLDKNHQLTSSDKAVNKETREYLDDGITLVFEEIIEIKKGFLSKWF